MMNAGDRRNLIARRFAQQGGRCHYCVKPMSLPPEIRQGPVPYKCVTADHIVPRSRGGSDKWANLVGCCRRCNEAKRDMPYEEWDAILSARFTDQLGN